MTNTLFVIKPDGMQFREQILSDISKFFKVDCLIDIVFSEELLRRIYPSDVGQEHYPALVDYMIGESCILGFLSGEHVLSFFKDFAGRYSYPEDCDKDSLRSKYGCSMSRTKSGLYIVKNAIHRCISQREFEYEKEVFSEALGKCTV